MKKLQVKCGRFPLRGYSAMYWFGKIYQNRHECGKYISPTTYNHEYLHSLQAKDFGLGNFFGHIIYYILYVIEWFVKMILGMFMDIRPYYSISFEQEAYNNQSNLDYDKKRKRFTWIKYIFKLV